MSEETMKDQLARDYHRVAMYQHDEHNPDKVYSLKLAYQQRNIFSRISRKFAAGKSLRVVEIGAGLGCLTELVLQSYPECSYTVVDNNQGTLDSITDRFPSVQPVLAPDMESLVSLEGEFDVIVAVDVWEHLPSELLLDYTQWCYSRLRAGGLFILQFPNWGCPLTASTFCSDLTHVNALNEKTVQQLFALAGIPANEYRIYNRRTPGLIGAVRDVCMEIYCLYIRMLHILFGTVRLKYFAPDLVVVVERSKDS